MIKSPKLLFLFSIAFIGCGAFAMEEGNQTNNNRKKVLLKLHLLINKDLTITGISKVAGDAESDQLRGKSIKELKELNYLEDSSREMLMAVINQARQGDSESALKLCQMACDITKVKVFPYDLGNNERFIGIHLKRFYVGLLAELSREYEPLLTLPGKSFDELLEDARAEAANASDKNRLLLQEMMELNDDAVEIKTSCDLTIIK